MTAFQGILFGAVWCAGFLTVARHVEDKPASVEAVAVVAYVVVGLWVGAAFMQ